MWVLIVIAAIIAFLVFDHYHGKEKRIARSFIEASDRARRAMPIITMQELEAARNPQRADLVDRGSVNDKRLDSTASALADELIRIGLCPREDQIDSNGRPMRTSWFLTRAWGRAREIGERLNEQG